MKVRLSSNQNDLNFPTVNQPYPANNFFFFFAKHLSMALEPIHTMDLLTALFADCLGCSDYTQILLCIGLNEGFLKQKIVTKEIAYKQCIQIYLLNTDCVLKIFITAAFRQREEEQKERQGRGKRERDKVKHDCNEIKSSQLQN